MPFFAVLDPETESLTDSESTIVISQKYSRKRSPVWAYFSVPDEQHKEQVKCDICNDEDGKVKTKDSSTTNLFSHLKNHHPAKYAEIAKVNNGGCSSKSKLKRKFGSGQPTLTEVLESKIPYAKDSERYRVLTQSVTRYLTAGNVTTI